MARVGDSAGSLMERQDPVTDTQFAWSPITERLGAELDIDLNEVEPSLVGEDLRRLLDERQLLLFRNQSIDYETQWRTVALLGNPLDEVKYVSTAHGLKGEVLGEPKETTPSTMTFHMDYAFLPTGPLEGISLYGEDVSGNSSPKFQGTSFVSARNCYLDFPDDVRAELEGRTAIYVYEQALSVEQQLSLRDLPVGEVKTKVTYWAEHPLFFPHPRTQEPVLLYCPWFTHSIVGMSPTDSKKWFDIFDAMLYRDGERYTHRWEHGDLLIWDNTALQHAKEVVPDVPGPVATRILRRVSFGPVDPRNAAPLRDTRNGRTISKTGGIDAE